ncbi:unnamed protein product [Adineta steineri]|uniref:Uncharacterized protein n=1 Tax=Adineta steineri TaxID=433720 RepID=A0A815L2K4_9BILA|nr:unnamed protein product [Adineta steineri]
MRYHRIYLFFYVRFTIKSSQSPPCFPQNLDNETINNQDPWRSQNTITGQWYHWQTFHKNSSDTLKWPVNWLNLSPTSYLGVIVYLTTKNEINSLRLSLTQLSLLLSNNPRPVVIFHEGDFNNNQTQQSLAQTLGPHTPLAFERIDFSNKSVGPPPVDPITFSRDPWRYQNTITGQWHHWQTLHKNHTNTLKWPVNWLNLSPPSYLGVIVYLTKKDEIDSLRISLAQLSFLLSNNPRPVVIFHEGDFDNNQTQQSLAQILGSRTPLAFERIDFSKKSVGPPPVNPTIPRSYFDMCRFFTLMLPNHPLLSLFTFYWRLDSHSYIFGPQPIKDPFELMEEQQIQYAFIMVNEEAEQYATGLWSLFQTFLTDHHLEPSAAFHKTQTNQSSEYSRVVIFTNFAIARVSLFRDHELMRAWLQIVDRNGGIYRYRWGDAPIHTLALTQFLQRNEIVRLRYFGYFHRREYVCANGTQEQLCKQEVKPFLTNPHVQYLNYDDGCHPSSKIPLCHYYPEIK